MASIGVFSLAEIARKLNTTPQAVSNWKARNQVPYHIVAKVLNKSQNIESGYTKSQIIQEDNNYAQAINFTDIFVTIAEQIKIIVLISFISISLPENSILSKGSPYNCFTIDVFCCNTPYDTNSLLS